METSKRLEFFVKMKSKVENKDFSNKVKFRKIIILDTYRSRALNCLLCKYKYFRNI